MTNFEHDIHIWAISGLYWPNFSGAAIQAHQILSRLTAQGFSVTVLTESQHEAAHLSGKTIERDGLAIKYLRVLPTREWRILARFPKLHKASTYFGGLLTKLSMNLQCAWRLGREGQRDDIVQFYTVSEFTMLPAWITKLKGMHPVIQMSLLGSDDPGSILKRVKRGNIIAALTLEPFCRAEAVIGLSSALISSYCAAGLDPDRVLRIPNGVDLEKFRPVSDEERIKLRQALGLKADHRYIIFVGWALHRKGIDVLIRSFIQVAAAVDDGELLVVGRYDFDSELYGMPEKQQLIDELKSELAQTGYASRVHWVGQLDDVHEYLQAADVFCFPTRREGLPNVVGEAMAMGLAIVLSHVEGITTDFFNSEDEGVLVTGYAPHDYAVELLRLLRSPQQIRMMGQAARSRAETDFHLDHITQQYAKLYRNITRSSAKALRVGLTEESISLD